MATESDIANLSARITSLEAQSRRLKALLGVAVLGAVAVVVLGQAASRPSRVVRASSVIIEDDAGRECGVLDTSGLRMRWGADTVRDDEGFSLSSGGLGIWQRRLGDKEPYRSNLTPAGGLMLLRPDGTSTSVEAPWLGLGGIRLNDRAGDCRMQLGLEQDGGPSVTLKRKRDPIVRDFIAKTPERLHNLNGASDKVPEDVAEAMRGEDATILGVASLERGETGVTEGRPEASIIMFNTRGHVLWKVP